VNLELGVIGNCEIAALIDGAARIVWGWSASSAAPCA
jgi:hypothetical protein